MKRKLPTDRKAIGRLQASKPVKHFDALFDQYVRTLYQHCLSNTVDTSSGDIRKIFAKAFDPLKLPQQ